MAKISIIVPVYNVELYMRKSIDSILNQTFSDIEIILIDDGSTDNSGKICDEYAEKDNRVKVFHKKNGGVSSARNLGLDNAKGNYIGFVDPDDVIHPNMYKELLANIESNHADISFCKYVTTYEQDVEFNDITQCEIREFGRNELLDSALVPNAEVYMLGTIWNRLYNKKIVNGIRFDEHLTIGEDTEFSFRCVMNSKKIILVDKILYYYFQRVTGAVAIQNNDSRIRALNMRRQIVERVSSNAEEIAISRIKSWYAFSLARTFLNVDKKYQMELYKEVKMHYPIIIKLKELHWKSRVLLTIKLLLR